MRNQHQIQAHNRTLIPASVNAILYPPSTLRELVTFEQFP